MAKELGRRTPLNETLLRISKEMVANREQPGKFTPAQLYRLLGLAHSSWSSRSSQAPVLQLLKYA